MSFKLTLKRPDQRDTHSRPRPNIVLVIILWTLTQVATHTAYASPHKPKTSTNGPEMATLRPGYLARKGARKTGITRNQHAKRRQSAHNVCACVCRHQLPADHDP